MQEGLLLVNFSFCLGHGPLLNSLLQLHTHGLWVQSNPYLPDGSRPRPFILPINPTALRLRNLHVVDHELSW